MRTGAVIYTFLFGWLESIVTRRSRSLRLKVCLLVIIFFELMSIFLMMRHQRQEERRLQRENRREERVRRLQRLRLRALRELLPLTLSRVGGRRRTSSARKPYAGG